jgi:phage baseplate assembly protein gpV
VSRQYGVVVGTVTDVDDPQKEGRIKVTYPFLPGKNESFWAPMATFMSGKARGSFFLPEEGDEVVVGFDHGDVDHPYVLGFVWNGADKPPEDDIDQHVRRLRTVSGHTLDFDDRDNKQKVQLVSQGGHKLTLSDAPQKNVKVETKGGHSAELDDDGKQIVLKSNGGHSVTLADGPPGSMTLQTSGGQKIELDDTPASISVQTSAGQKVTLSTAPPSISIQSTPHQITLGPAGVSIQTAGPLTVQGTQMTLTASALVVSAPITTFAGTVIIPTLIASSVVSPLYTPGGGNIL